MGREGAMLTGINEAVIRKQLNAINVSTHKSLGILIPKGKQTYPTLFMFRLKMLECG